MFDTPKMAATDFETSPPPFAEHLVLTFTLPDTYPDVPPEIEVEGPRLEPRHEREVLARMTALVWRMLMVVLVS